MDYCPYLLKQHNVERRGIIGHDFRGLLIVNLLRNFFQYVSSKLQNLKKKEKLKSNGGDLQSSS